MASESKSDASASPVAVDKLAAAIRSGERNPRSIPAIAFLEDIDAFLKANATDAESVLQEIGNLTNMYKFMEGQLLESRNRLKVKIPDIEASLECIAMLKKKKEAEETMSTFYNLSDQVHLKATIKPEDRVGLWMGANVMVEYSYDEAEKLLQENLAAAKAKLADNSEDLAFLRDQVITAEVNLARVYNYDVKQRRAAKLAESATA